ncbi:MAG: hypothetical protein U1G08_21235 [Verrucomicrobiota bacterium]
MNKTPRLSGITSRRILTRILGIGLLALPLATFGAGGKPATAGGSGGGGGGGGGSTPVTPPATQNPSIAALNVTSGYGKYGGRGSSVQASYAINRGTANLPFTVHVRITDVTYGWLVFDLVTPISSQTVGNDYLSYNRTYRVSLDLLDSTGAVIDSRSTTIATPATAKPRTT